MFFKNTGIFTNLLILVVLISLTGVAAFLLDRHFENQIALNRAAVDVTERNISLVGDILLNAEKIFTQEEQSKENIARAEDIYDFSLSALKNGGIPPEYEKEIYLPFPGQEVVEQIVELERFWYSFKKPVQTILNEQAYTIEKQMKDTVINGLVQTKQQVSRFKNRQVAEAISRMTADSEILIQKSNSLIGIYKNRIESIKFKQSITFGIALSFVLIFSGIIVWLIKFRLLKNLSQISDEISKLSEGETGEKNEYKNKDELKPVYEHLNVLKLKYRNLIEFIHKLTAGKYNAEIEEINQESKLDSGLIELRNKLAQGEKEAKLASQAEERRKWAIEGQTKFNEILRVSASNVQELADAVIKNLVIFINAAQGGLFLKEGKDEEERNNRLNLLSAFAYDRKKFFTKKIQIGSGLVGMAALERNTVWLDKIPRDYMEVESGLGEAPPRSLLIVPLKTEAELLGIIEIASLNKFKKEEVEFIEDLAQNIAATIQSAKVSERTSELLNESRKKSEELASRDSEMRQTIKELQKAKAEAERNDAEMSALISALDQAMISAEISTRRRINSANRLFLTKADYHFDEVDGKPFSDYFSPEENEPDIKEIVEKVRQGQTVRAMLKLISKYKSEYAVLGQFTPVRDASGKVNKILFLGNDITKRIEFENKNQKLLKETIEKAEQMAAQEKEMRDNFTELLKTQKDIKAKEFEVSALLSAIDANLIKAEFNREGKLRTANRKFIDTLKCRKEELNKKTIGDFFNNQIIDDFEEKWKKLFDEDKAFQSGTKLADKNGKPVWLMISFTPVKDEQNEITKIVLLANDITELKQAEQKILAQSDSLREQEKLMKQNMEELLEEQNQLSRKLRDYMDIEEDLAQEYMSKKDEKYFKWIDSL